MISIEMVSDGDEKKDKTHLYYQDRFGVGYTKGVEQMVF